MQNKDELSALQISIIELIKTDKTITAEMVAKKLKIATRSIQRNIKLLKDLGLYVRKGGDNCGYWELLKV